MQCPNGHENRPGAQWCATCGLTFAPPLPPPVQANKEPLPAAWWPIDRWAKKWKVVGLIAATAVVLGLFALSSQNSDRNEPTEPSGGMELCEILRDPEYRRLTRGDLMRMGDMTDYEIQRYVRARCPDQYDRVD